MTPLVLVDVGNTRAKVALGGDPVRVILRQIELDLGSWVRQIQAVAGPPPWRWAISGVGPTRLDQVRSWAESRGESVRRVHDFRDVPLRIDECDPSQIGVDRLLDALAAIARKRPGVPAITVDAGTALVVNLVSEDGVFLGGGIAPGLTALFDALYATTAKLPRVRVGEFDRPRWPGTTTVEAITAGCFHAAVGGVRGLVEAAAQTLTGDFGGEIDLFLTGGDAGRLSRHVVWPAACRATPVETLTLEGLMLAADHHE